VENVEHEQDYDDVENGAQEAVDAAKRRSESLESPEHWGF
jgi:hypothetical protein